MAVVHPTFVVSLQPDTMPGDPNPPMASKEQLAVLDQITPEIAETLLGEFDGITVKLQRAKAAEVWVTINGDGKEPPVEEPAPE